MHNLAGGPMGSLACLAATYALNALWQIPWIAGAGWLMSRLLRPAGPRAQHRVWVATLLLSLAMPGMAGAAVAGGWFGSWGMGMTAVSLAMVTGGGQLAPHSGSLVLPGWLLWSVCGLYAGTVLYFSGRLAWLVIETRALTGESASTQLPRELEAAWIRCRRVFNASGTALRTSGRLRGVVTAGLRRPVIVVPDGFVDKCTEREFLTAVGHECAHIRRRDPLMHLLYEAVSVVTAFHPVTWIVKAKVAETREMTCDLMVVETLLDAKTYTQSLLRLAEQMLMPGAGPTHAIGMFDANVLEKRIMRMKAAKRKIGWAAQMGLTAGAVLLLGSVAATGASMGRGVEAQAASQSAQDQGKVYRPGGDVTAPVLTYAPDPEFPKAEKKSKGGICVVGVVVDAQGMPQGVHIERSLKADFDANALAIVRQYRFKPGLRQGNPVAVRINIEVNYRRY